MSNLNICTYKHYGKIYTGRNFSKKNLINFQICGNKLHKRLSLNKETVADDNL